LILVTPKEKLGTPEEVKKNCKELYFMTLVKKTSEKENVS